MQAGSSIKTTYSYDARGNLTQVTRPLDNPAGTLTVHYNRTNGAHPEDVITKQDGDGKVWSYTYDDAKGYLITPKDPMSPADVTHFGYDGAGRLVCKVAPRGNTSCPNAPIGNFETQYTYDAAGGQTNVLAPLGQHSTALFDANGNRTSAMDANGNNSTYVYDAADRLTKVVHPDTSFDQTSYDDLNNLTSQTTVQGAGTYFRFDYTYDLLNHMTAAIDNASPRRQTGYSYDAQGELLSLTDSQNQITAYAYDGRGSLSQVSYNDGLTQPVAYVYDADGQRLSMTDGTGSSSYSWDSLHRLKQATNGNSATVAYGYDYRNDVTSITYPGSTGTVQRRFDDSGRLQHVQDWLTSPSNSGITFAYDPDGNLQTATYPNGVIATSTYDNADQVQRIADTGAGALFNFNYGQVPRDGLGQLKSDGSTTYGYDTKNRVSALNGVANSWTYDPANDLTKSPAASSLTYDGANQLTTVVAAAGTTHIGFDPRGNRVVQSPPVGPGVNYVYDQGNRLVSYNSTYSYTYNGDGLRVSKATATSVTQFASDTSGSLPLTIQAATTTTTNTSYLTGPGGLPVEQITSSGSVSFFHQDQLGSTRLMTGSASPPATIVGSYSYDAFGAITVNSGSAPAFGYAGQYTDAETSLIYLRARYYDPATAQFLSRDTAVAATRQPYAYVADNPLNTTDPTGLCDFFGCIGVIAQGLHDLPGAIVHDAGQGQANFVNNFQNGGYVAVGVPLIAAGGLAAAGLGAGAIGALTAGGGASAAQILQPAGQMIGNPGTSNDIRELQGGLPEAQSLFNKLCSGGTQVTNSNYPGTLSKLENGAPWDCERPPSPAVRRSTSTSPMWTLRRFTSSDEQSLRATRNAAAA